MRVVNARFGHLADRYAAQGNTRMVGLMHLAGPTLLYFLNGFLPVFFAILLGSSAVSWFLGGHSTGDNQWIDRRQ